MRNLSLLPLAAGLFFAAPVLSAPADALYKEKCSLCHDSGANQAPRMGNLMDWKPRIAKGRTALLRAAIEGMPNTAMMARGGFAELSDAEVSEIVDHMLGALGDAIADSAAPAVALPARSAPLATKVDDASLTASVAQALRASLNPSASIDTTDGVRVAGIRIESHSGRVVLHGMVRNAEYARRAAEAAAAVPGVASVDERLVPAELFEHD